MRRIYTAVLAFALVTFSAAPAAAHNRHFRWETSTTISSMEGCGAQGLLMDVVYKERSGRTTIKSIFVDSSDDMKGFPLYLSISDKSGKVLYQDSTINVGDGLDYLWIKGRETNHDGERVRIGSEPSRGWSSITGKDLVVSVSQAERRYCHLDTAL